MKTKKQYKFGVVEDPLDPSAILVYEGPSRKKAQRISDKIAGSFVVQLKK